MKTIWKVLAWVFFLCGLVAYLTAWMEVFTGSVILGMTSTVLFYDAISTGIFSIFSLAWGSLSTKK